MTQTRIEDGIWCNRSRTWEIKLSTGLERTSLCVDHIIYATGATPNIEKVACMQKMLEKYPIQSINGLARLTDDLMWQDDVPLFLTGGLAALRLGPGAANLAGARQGAERIAWKIEDLLGTGKRSLLDGKDGAIGEARSRLLGEEDRRTIADTRSEFIGGFGNQFEALTLNER